MTADLDMVLFQSISLFLSIFDSVYETAEVLCLILVCCIIFFLRMRLNLGFRLYFHLANQMFKSTRGPQRWFDFVIRLNI